MPVGLNVSVTGAVMQKPKAKQRCREKHEAIAFVDISYRIQV
jgi:hypothetical protein